MIETVETLMSLATSPSGFVAIGMAATLLVLVRRSAHGRKRTD